MSNQVKKKSTTRSAQNGRRKPAASAPASGKASAKKTAAAPVPERKPLLSARAKNDLIGLLIVIVAGVLMVLVFLPSNAVGARFVSEGLRLVCGEGALLLPFMLLAWALTFFIKRRFTNSSFRLALGLAVIYLALIAVFAVLIPQAMEDPSRVFEPALLMNGGGYVGGAVAWALLTLVGSVATMIILIGLILMGLVFIGLSITGLVEWIFQSIKNRNAHDDGIPLPGTSDALYQPTHQINNGVASNGSAYQMGPGAPGAPGAYGLGRPAGTTSQQAPLHTGVMDAGQLENTLYRPRRQESEDDLLGEGAAAALGSTRRRLAWLGKSGEIDAQAPTMKRDIGDASRSDNGAEDSSAEEDTGDKGALGSESGAPATTVLAGAAGKKKSRKAAGKSGSSGASAFFGRLYPLPSTKLLRVSRDKAHTKAGASELRSTANRLQGTLEEFRVDGEVVGWIAGPTVTLYKISLGEGVRLNRITALQSDIQLALAAQAIRIVAPIPGTSLVGIEIPNASRNDVLLGDVLDSARDDSILALAIGKDVEGESIVADLASMPHLLIGGTTGSGKSVAINSIIMSLLMRTTPDQVRMIMIDPKRVELTLYNGIPHLYVPVVTDAGQAASALAWCVAEMDRRLKLFEKHAVKNIRQFNTRVAERLEQLEKESGNTADDSRPLEDPNKSDGPDASEQDEARTTAADADEIDITVEQENLRATLPYLVIVIDELADLMMLNGKEVESAISRLAQLARAAGLHLIVATQRPSTNVITGLIKANIVNRIAFTVASGIDSRVILDTPGAEDLIGLGDMLFSRPEYSKPVRIQGCLVSEPEIETVVEYWRGLGTCDYHEEILLAGPGGSASSGGMSADSLEDDPLLWEAAEIVVSSQLGSTSTLQRRLKVGYARAGRIMDMLEMKGVVGPPNGSKPREVLIDDVLDLETLRAFG